MIPYTLKVRQGKPGGGKGALIQENLSATLSCNNDQVLFAPVKIGGDWNRGERRINTEMVSDCLNSWDIQSKHIQPEDGKAEALYSGECRWGGGESYVMQKCYIGDPIKIDEKGVRPSYGLYRASYNQGRNAQYNFEVRKECQPTLTAKGPGAVGCPIAFGISSYDSNSMKSSNPNSGIYKADTSRTLDKNGGNPDCQQGGMAVVAIEGNGSRPSHQGTGYSDDNVSFTLNATEHHGIAYEIGQFVNSSGNGISGTLDARYYLGCGARNGNEREFVGEKLQSEYIVRRLTPTECARLQGFPDWWCADLDDPDPSGDDISFWQEVWKTYAEITGGKPRSESQIRKWLAHPHSDSAEYKMWGNGVALPNVFFVLSGIAWANGLPVEDPPAEIPKSTTGDKVFEQISLFD